VAENAALVKALKTEIRLLGHLEHANIVRYLGFQEDAVYCNIFLEYASEGSISANLKRIRTGFSENVCKFFTAQILHGLAYLHRNNVIHRDLKGDNVLIARTGLCKIADFGISKDMARIYETHASATRALGSVYWSAPEIFSRRGYCGKADIWSLGCVYVEMCSGQRPWPPGAMPIDVVKSLAAGNAPPVHPWVSNVAWNYFIQWCFVRGPRERPKAEMLLTLPFLQQATGWRFTSFTS